MTQTLRDQAPRAVGIGGRAWILGSSIGVLVADAVGKLEAPGETWLWAASILIAATLDEIGRVWQVLRRIAARHAPGEGEEMRR